MSQLFKFIGLAILFVCASSHVKSQTMPKAVESNQFSESLLGLKNSADKLSAGNLVLKSQNNAWKLRLNQMQLQLQALGNENNILNKSSLKLQDNNSLRAKQIANLEKDIFDATAKLERMMEDIKVAKDDIERAKKEDLELNPRLVQLGQAQALTQAPIDEKAQERQKEKLRLLKMIFESKQRQEEIFRNITFAKKHMPVPVPSPTAVLNSNNHDVLVKDIQSLQDEIQQLSKLPDQKTFSRAYVWTAQQMRQLEDQVKDLQKNHDQLEELVIRMQQKSKSIAVAPDQLAENNKLQMSLLDLDNESKRLKRDLTDLREKMVELDKRKAFISTLNTQ